MKRPGIAPFAIAAISCLCSAQPAAAKDAPLWSECGQVQGLEKLTRDKSLKILVVGEPHGANETINTFKNIVCAYRAAGKSVAIGLERDTAETPALERFMKSAGSVEDKTHFLTAAFHFQYSAGTAGEAATEGFDVDTLPQWEEASDGRSSAAMFELIDAIRSARRSGDKSLSLFYLRPTMPLLRDERSSLDMPSDLSQLLFASDQGYDGYLRAAYILDYQNARKPDVILILTGNGHAYRTRREISGASILPMAGYFGEETFKSIELAPDGGAAWNISPHGDIGPHPFPLDETCTADRVYVEYDAPDERGFSGRICLKDITPSPPAIRLLK